MPGTLDGRVALVTGGASGIGRATALTFAREGAKLVIANMNTDGRQQTAHMITENGGEATLGTTMVSTVDHKEEDWNRVLSINLTGVWLCMKYEITQLLKQGGGAIVNTASVAGLVGSRGAGSAYAASKHGVVGLTKTAALEYAKQGIRVNCVRPGVIRTPMMERMLTRTPELEQQYMAAEPIGRLGLPEEVAESVVWLCSDAASFVTGHTMTVDGGFVVQ
jgi:NAD(P)-dependent dehydrogenase (short-subunit alcohol dehydrogenase family)